MVIRCAAQLMRINTSRCGNWWPSLICLSYASLRTSYLWLLIKLIIPFSAQKWWFMHTINGGCDVRLGRGFNINQSVLKAHKFPCLKKVSISQQGGTCSSKKNNNSPATTMLIQAGADHYRKTYGVTGGWAITNYTAVNHNKASISYAALGLSIWCVWHVEFLPALLFFFTISLCTKAAHARHLPKSEANFKLKHNQKGEQESAGALKS